MLRNHRFFIVTTLTALVIVTSLLLLYRHLTMESLVSQEERASTNLTTVLANVILPRFQVFLNDAHRLDREAIRQASDFYQLDAQVNEFIRGTHILKVQIIDATGRTLYSSNHDQVGNNKEESEGFRGAMRRGRPTSQFSFRDSFTGAHGVYSKLNVVATYIPVRNPQNDELFGAFEIYSNVTALVDHLNATQTKITIMVSASMLVIYLILFAVSRRADRMYHHQTEERIRHEANIRFHTYHDTVTKLPNRASFLERLDEVLGNAAKAQRIVGVFMIDVDRFKMVNDSMGHDVGDEVLRIVTRRLQQVIRECDLLFRIGGDEFAIVPEPMATPDRLAHLARRVIESLRVPIEVKSQRVMLTASIGISVYPRDDTRAAKLVKNAEAALYLSKQNGRNRYTFYTSELNAQATERLRYETALQQALENNEFILHYQPRIDTASGEMVGMEALLRWQRPGGELVPPNRFVPILEDRDLIVEVGEWVLRTAARQVRHWLDAGYEPGRVSVNVSPRQFHRDNFSKVVSDAIAAAGIPAACLELELTEGVLLDNSRETIDIMRDLKQLGIKLSIDDFGTGYSSLNYLKLLPIDYLKIDRSFIRDLSVNEKDVAIVNTITTLAKELHLQVVAEGVEHDDQWKLLQTKYCQELQGFLFSRPLPAETITGMLQQRHQTPDKVLQRH